ncbi:MAG: hypothetical protein LBH19_00040 [Dysgonamonadaceae bacterium]|jgi:hypothetical protein|nr:hypothetical protein [Dysgonamonadaceae bacterium]
MQTDTFHSFHFAFEKVRPRFEDIHVFLKSENSDAGYPVNEAIREIMPLLADNDGIKGGYILRKADKVHLHTGAQIKSYMKGAEYLALFTCTAGTIFTDLASRYNQAGDYLEAFVADAIGSLTVEKAMDTIQTQLEEEMKAGGLSITNRYSPGYCNWPVSGQRELFDAMGEMPVAISLTESCLMLPVKSVSGIIGVGRNMKKRAYACRICKNKNCIYRKIIQ